MSCTRCGKTTSRSISLALDTGEATIAVCASCKAASIWGFKQAKLQFKAMLADGMSREEADKKMRDILWQFIPKELKNESTTQLP